MQLFTELNRRHRSAVLLITHNLALVRQTCSRVVVMYAGRVVEDLPTDRLLDGARHPYTRALVGSVPRISDGNHRFTAIPGDVPDVASRPPGCAFHPRCPLATAECRTDVPAPRTLADGSRVACHHAGD